MILRLSPDTIADMNDYSCIAFREVGYLEQDGSGDAYTYETASIPSVNGNTLYYENAIYRHTEFLTNANGIALKTFTFSSQYDWGFNLIPEHYDFRLPDLKYQCGAYAR